MTYKGGDCMVIHKRILIPTMLVLVGLAVILAVPTVYEGPLLLYINEEHAIRLIDAAGLVLVVPSWLYLNLVLLRRVRKRKC